MTPFDSPHEDSLVLPGAFLRCLAKLRISPGHGMLILQIAHLGEEARMRDLASRMGSTVRAVQQALRRLESEGHVRRERGSCGRNRFHLDGLLKEISDAERQR